MLKNAGVLSVAILALMLCGCSRPIKASFTPNVAYPINRKGFEKIVRKSYQVVGPLVIKKYIQQRGGYFLVPGDISDTSSGIFEKYITTVPAGAILTVHHVSRSERRQLQGIVSVFCFIAELKTKGIFRGRFEIESGLMCFKGQESGSSKWIKYKNINAFNEEFAGLNPKYLKELKKKKRR